MRSILQHLLDLIAQSFPSNNMNNFIKKKNNQISMVSTTKPYQLNPHDYL